MSLEDHRGSLWAMREIAKRAKAEDESARKKAAATAKVLKPAFQREMAPKLFRKRA